jgi:hypothetical protein
MEDNSEIDTCTRPSPSLRGQPAAQRIRSVERAPERPLRSVAEDTVKSPTTLRRLHPCVSATSRSVGRARRLDDGRLEIGGRPGVVRLVVSRARVRSALLLLQGIFRKAERRGWSVLAVEHERYVSAPGVAIQVREHRYPIETDLLRREARAAVAGKLVPEGEPPEVCRMSMRMSLVWCQCRLGNRAVRGVSRER